MADMTIIKGDDYRIDLVFSNDDGTYLNLTDSTASFSLKTRHSDVDSEALISKDVTVHDDAVNGATHIDLSHMETKIPVGEYFGDIQLTDSAGKITTFWRGKVEIVYEVTMR